MRDYDSTVKNLRETAKGLLFDAMPYRASVMRDAADAIEELLAESVTLRNQLPKWVSVEDEPPETGKPIFVVDNRGNVANAILSGNYVVGDEGGYGYIGRITYWCKSLPLPEPPKGVE